MTVFVFILMGLCAIYDLRSKRIPLVLIALCAVLSVIESVIGLTDHVRTPVMILAALMPGIFLLFLSFVTKQAVGFGDGLLMCAVGPILGFRLMMSGVMLGFFLSSLAAIFLLIFKKADKKTKMPFVPFLASAMGVMRFVLL